MLNPRALLLTLLLFASVAVALWVSLPGPRPRHACAAEDFHCPASGAYLSENSVTGI